MTTSFTICRNRSRHRYRHQLRERGVTMVELLAVMAILAIVAVIGGLLLFSGPAPAIRMQTGVAEAAALFNKARAVAQSRNASVRVLVSRDDEDRKKNLRYMLVVVHERGEKPEEPWKWNPVGNGIYLPQGIFYLPSKPPNLMWDSVSRMDDDKRGTPWDAFHLGSSGHGGGGQFLLIAGARPPGEGEDLTDSNSIDGFLFRRNGYLTFFENFEHVKQYMKEMEKRK